MVFKQAPQNKPHKILAAVYEYQTNGTNQYNDSFVNVFDMDTINSCGPSLISVLGFTPSEASSLPQITLILLQNDMSEQ